MATTHTELTHPTEGTTVRLTSERYECWYRGRLQTARDLRGLTKGLARRIEQDLLRAGYRRAA